MLQQCSSAAVCSVPAGGRAVPGFAVLSISDREQPSKRTVTWRLEVYNDERPSLACLLLVSYGPLASESER